MSDRFMTYEEAATALGRTPEAVRQLAKRKHFRRTMGNDGKARIAIPEEMIEEASDRPASVRPPRSAPERPPGHDHEPTTPAPDTATTPATPSEDARSLISHLEARILEMAEELRGARAQVADLDTEARALRAVQLDQTAQVARLEAEALAARHHAEDIRIERDRLLEHVLAPAPPGFIDRLKRLLGT